MPGGRAGGIKQDEVLFKIADSITYRSYDPSGPRGVYHSGITCISRIIGEDDFAGGYTPPHGTLGGIRLALEGDEVNQPIPIDRPARRRLKLTLRSMMVLVLILGGGLGWFVHSVRVQREAVVAIERAGGNVIYDWDWEWIPTMDRPDPSILVLSLRPPPSRRGAWGLPIPWIRTLARLLGPDCVGTVKHVSFPGGERDRSTNALMAEVGRLRRLEELYLDSCKLVTDDGLAHLRNLSELRGLNLVNSGVRGSGLVHLKRLRRLEELSLTSLSVRDSDLAHLSKLSSLERLELSGPHITDAGLAHLKDLTNLRWFEYFGRSLTSAGLIHLRGMSRLEGLVLRGTMVNSLKPLANLQNITTLNLTGAPIDGVGLAPVAGFSRLKSLNLTASQVEDAGLVHVAGLANLNYLTLNGTHVTDAGLVHLANLPRLRHLGLGLTAITDAGITSLSNLKQCQFISVHGTGVTQSCVSSMKKTNPKMQISR